MNHDGLNLEDFYLAHTEWCRECGWAWPQTCVPLIHIGCGIYSCIDCSGEGLIYDFDPNDEGDETDPNWLNDALQPTTDSLATLLSDWLSERELEKE